MNPFLDDNAADPYAFLDDGVDLIRHLFDVGDRIQRRPLDVPGAQNRIVYLPDDLDHVEIEISREVFNWRIHAVDAPQSSCAFWCYPGGYTVEDLIVVFARAYVWDGDPAGEPTGYIKRKLPTGGRWMSPLYRRRPGKPLDEDARLPLDELVRLGLVVRSR